MDLFDATDGGAMKVSGNGRKLKRLKLITGERAPDECGGKVVLRSKMKIRRFKKAGGRRAVGRLASSGLIVPVRARYKVAGKRRTGKIIMLWDDAGRQTDTARVEIGDCFVNFIGRK